MAINAQPCSVKVSFLITTTNTNICRIAESNRLRDAVRNKTPSNLNTGIPKQNNDTDSG